MDLLNPLIKFAIIISLLLIPVTGNSGKFVTEHLAKAQFSTHIKKRKPVDNIKRIDTGYKGVYFFVDVRDCEDCDIEHEWWHKGRKVSSVAGEIKSDRYRWWSRKTLNKDLLGDWTVKVYIDGDLEYTKTVTFYKASVKQKNARPLKNRMNIQEASECEIQLRYFSDKANESPNDNYYKFMLDKWGKRCLP